MKTTVDADIVFVASAEAKICLDCGIIECRPSHCRKYAQAMKALRKAEKLTAKEKRN